MLEGCSNGRIDPTPPLPIPRGAGPYVCLMHARHAAAPSMYAGYAWRVSRPHNFYHPAFLERLHIANYGLTRIHLYVINIRRHQHPAHDTRARTGRLTAATLVTFKRDTRHRAQDSNTVLTQRSNVCYLRGVTLRPPTHPHITQKLYI